MLNPIYVVPVLALSIAAFTGFCAAVIALLVLGVVAGTITLLSQ